MQKNTLILSFSVFILQIFTSSKALDVTQYGAIGDGLTDDSQAFLKAWEAVCRGTGDGQLIVPAGMTFMLQPSKFQGSCKSTPIVVRILGNLVASSRGNWEGDKDQWILFSNIDGLVVEGNGEINGQGSSWWEHKGSSRPTALKFKSCNNLRLSGLTHVDSAKAHIHINDCNGASISNLRINAPESSPNTDGIDVAASSNVMIQDCVIATGDDCIAINSGTSNIRVSGIDCGPGHGISIGSLGKDGETASVEDVCVQNCNFRGTTNGARIKTWPGGTGYARRITFNGITLDNVENPIIIDQHYNNGGSEKNTDDKSSAVEVSKVVYSNFVGTSKSEYGVDFRCSEAVPCTDIIMKDVKIETASSGSGQVAQGQCLNVRGVSTLAVPVEEILTRVPVKDLIRFRRVCKTWRSLFQDERFYRQHMTHALTRIVAFGRLDILLGRFSDDISGNKPEMMILEESNLNVRAQRLILGAALVGHCHGLLCFCFEHRAFGVWNPSLREFRKIRTPDVSASRMIDFRDIGMLHSRVPGTLVGENIYWQVYDDEVCKV
ncbi:hypothetical protein Bca4012_066584 [Brassica carinata]